MGGVEGSKLAVGAELTVGWSEEVGSVEGAVEIVALCVGDAVVVGFADVDGAAV